MKYMRSYIAAAFLACSLIGIVHAGPADSKINAAAELFQNGDYKGAAAKFKQALAQEPNNAMAWHFYGQCLAQLGDDMGARRAYAKALKLKPVGDLAERTQKFLNELPEPDLFKMQIDSGLTLGDWLPEAEKQAGQGKSKAVLKEIAQYLDQFGPVPQLLALQDKLSTQAQAEQEEQLRSALAGIKVTDAASAKTALPQIRSLLRQAPDSLQLLRLEARACHYLQDYPCAQHAYGAWLKHAPGDDLMRKNMVSALMLAKQHQALPAAPDLPIALSDEVWGAIVNSEMYRNLPAPKPVQYTVKDSVLYSYSKDDEQTEETTSLEKDIGRKCLARKSLYAVRHQDGAEDKPFAMTEYICGGIKAEHEAEGRVEYLISHFKSEGSLFPMRVGNRLTIDYERTSLTENKVWNGKTTHKCSVIGQEKAERFAPNLTGVAWKVHCDDITSDNVKLSVDDFYLENPGIWLHQIGVGQSTTQKNGNEVVMRINISLPKSGNRIASTSNIGGEEVVTTRTYSHHEWSPAN